MNNFTYETQGTNTYLVYTVQSDDYVDSMSLGMLTNNKISGLAPTMFTQMDTTKYIKFNVSTKVSVKQFFNGPVNKKRLLGVFKGIVNAMLSAEDYMIDINSIIMDLDYIFSDVSTCETVLICLPVMEDLAPSIDLGNFFKNIMFSTQFDPTENCDHVAKIINYLNSTPVFSLLDFSAVLDDIQDGKSPVVIQKVQSTEQQNIMQPTVQQHNIQPSVVKNTQPSVISGNQENTSVTSQRSAENLYVRPTQINNTFTQEAKTEGLLKEENKNTEKTISLFYLLQHYNKENAAAYKAQKEAQKGQKSFADTKVEAKQPKTVKKDSKKTETPKQGFAIPGQEPSFAIPGRQSSVQQIPVQPTSSPSETACQCSTQPSQTSPAVTPQGRSMNFGETTVLNAGGIGETTVLNASMLNQQQTITPHLIRARNNEKVMVNKPVFRIGKERSYVDYFIGDNSGISRSHANIVSKDGKYFVVDTNSTNHTFVNGTIIQSNLEVEINHGDTVRFANEDFEFKLF